MMFDFARGGIVGSKGTFLGLGGLRLEFLDLVVTRSPRLNDGRMFLMDLFFLGSGLRCGTKES